MERQYLNNPDYLELDDAYRGMVKLEEIIVKTPEPKHIIRDMEKIGFVGIVISIDARDTAMYKIRAFKGKHGPCHFTGWQAAYSGAAMMALDDDHHLLALGKEIPVCDKTWQVYTLPPYEGLIKCRKQTAEPDHPDTEIREGEDFESSLDKLYDRLKDTPQDFNQRVAMYYPGPFRMLILQDGIMVRRGKWNSIPVGFAKDLQKKDGLPLPETKELIKPVFFQEVYKNQGSLALLDDMNPEAANQPEFATDLTCLPNIGKSIKTRLLKLIDQEKKYFVLIGNEADDKLGCCPSEEVSEANRLVKSGILKAFGEPVQGDSCPVTLYAFKGELKIGEKRLVGEMDHQFREEVRTRLIRPQTSGVKQILNWILWAFLIISFALAVRQCYQQAVTTTAEQSLFNLLNPGQQNQVYVVLFHNQKRCYQCRQMELHTMEVLNASYSDQLEIGQLAYKSIIMDDPENFGLVNGLGIFGPTLVLVYLDHENELLTKVLFEATGLYRDGNAFKDYVETELNQFLKNADE